MIGDYVVIRHVDNGFFIEVNEYSSDKKRSKYVARNEEELYAVIQKRVFPIPISAETELDGD